ncbi:MAG: phosphodiester glycosidase family protein [Clostridia bacterium]|nr:phosphodiester glycosidase family protein [Clostridia bacterium]
MLLVLMFPFFCARAEFLDIPLPGGETGNLLDKDVFTESGEEISVDLNDGRFLYRSKNLSVEIERRIRTYDRLAVWYQADIRVRMQDGVPVETWDMVTLREENPMQLSVYPHVLARRTGTVFAINGDFAHVRQSYVWPGVVIRRGRVFSDAPQPSDRHQFPPEDTLAIYPDGDMTVALSDAYSAQAYLDMGATTVLSFGPVLVHAGEIQIDRISRHPLTYAQRTAIGMVAPGHYVAMVCDGRSKDSKGLSLLETAQIMKDLGCSVALNLDGGQSSAMVFLGRQVNQMVNSLGNSVGGRKAPEILGIGHTSSMSGEEEPFSWWK